METKLPFKRLLFSVKFTFRQFRHILGIFATFDTAPFLMLAFQTSIVVIEIRHMIVKEEFHVHFTVLTKLSNSFRRKYVVKL